MYYSLEISCAKTLRTGWSELGGAHMWGGWIAPSHPDHRAQSAFIRIGVEEKVKGRILGVLTSRRTTVYAKIAPS